MNWPILPIGNVITSTQYGLSISSDADGNIPIVGMKDIQGGRVQIDHAIRVALTDEQSADYKLRKGDILINRTNSPDLVGKTGLVLEDQNAVFASYLVRIKIDELQADPEFISYCMNSEAGQRQMKTLSTRAISQANINPTTFKKHFHIPFPPFDAQHEIVQILRVWDTAIEKMERLIKAKQTFLSALYQRFFSPRLIKEFGWKKYRLDQLLIVRNEKAVPSDETPLYSLTIENGVTAKTDRYNRDFLVKDTKAKTYKVVYPGDIVFNPANLRWGAIARSELKHRVAVSPIYEVLSVNDKKVNPDLLTHALTCPRQIKIFSLLVEGTLIERMAVKLDTFLHAEVNLPIARDQQGKITELLNIAKQEITKLKQLVDAYCKQKRGLMQKLLTGTWRMKAWEECQ